MTLFSEAQMWNHEPIVPLHSKKFWCCAGMILLGSGSQTVSHQALAQPAKDHDRPNIIWLTIEDMSPDLKILGDSYAHTPHLDDFARQAYRFELTWSSAPVCSPARTALITGMYPASLGAHNHRSSVGLPPEIELFPGILRKEGYYATNNHKEDYNVVQHNAYSDIWNESSSEAHYRNRPSDDSPFFAVFNNHDSHGSRIRQRTDLPFHDPEAAPVPPFHPDTPEIRRDWAQYYHSVSVMDEWFGEKIQNIREDGLMDNTIIFVFSDHGGGMPSYKQLAYNRGLKVPFFIYIPDRFQHLAPDNYVPGGVSFRPVEFVDMAPTMLSLIGVRPPEWMQGKAFLGPFEEQPRQYLFGFRGRMDERIDMVRTVRDHRYIYIRNYMPHLKHGYFSEYMYTFSSTHAWREAYHAGELNPHQASFWEPKPPEELYDLLADPFEIHNLASSPHHQDILDRFRQVHRHHVLQIRDTQFLPESEMHLRAKESTAYWWNAEDRLEATSIYEMAQDTLRFPLSRIFTYAELAAGNCMQALPLLLNALSDPDPAIRYWAATGLLIRGSRVLNFDRVRIFEAMDDAHPAVRIVASEFWALHGDSLQQQKAIEHLVKLARPDKQGAFVSIEALNTLKRMDHLPESAMDQLLEMEKEDHKAPWRGANEFIIRLIPGYTRL